MHISNPNIEHNLQEHAGLGRESNLTVTSGDQSVSSSNVGFKMLQKFGWKGTGLGKTEQGDYFSFELKKYIPRL
jgi:hypothetical protein